MIERSTDGGQLLPPGYCRRQHHQLCGQPGRTWIHLFLSGAGRERDWSFGLLESSQRERACFNQMLPHY